MGLLQILAIAALTCLGSGYADDVFVTCEVTGDTSNSGIYSAPADTLAFGKACEVAADSPMAVDDSGTYAYIYNSDNNEIMKCDFSSSTTSTVTTINNAAGVLALDGNTLYYFGTAGGLYSVDLSTGSEETVDSSLPVVREASIVGSNIYMVMGIGNEANDIRSYNLDTEAKATLVTSAMTPHGMVVDTSGSDNVLYYGSASNDKSLWKITTLNLATSAEEVLVQYSGPVPTAIALYNGGLMYTRNQKVYKVSKTGDDPQPYTVGRGWGGGTGLTDCDNIYDVAVDNAAA
ncbi:uncharacterized protein [Amphiura filiformis]|uniref:uncharacterized protein n=1 Tax=Amphiura filiformis TaxID=82378 RepID=UPI003B210E5A